MFALWTIFSDHSHWGVTLFFGCRKPCFWTRMGLYYTQQSLWKMVVTKTSPRFEIGDRHQVFLTTVRCCILHHGQHLQTLVCYCSPYFKAFLEPNVPFLATYKAEGSELLWFMICWTAMTFEWTINMRLGMDLFLDCKWCSRWFHRKCDIAIL